ncbi:MAG: AI-2E family transporter [Gammaproteobacteria bacterium]|nr:AI-2E family transporter [Gammaproteobacteria bacterium]
MSDNSEQNLLSAEEFVDGIIRLALVGLLLLMCFRIFSPFVGLMTWAMVLAVTLYPLHQSLASRLNQRQGRAATVIVLIGILVIGGPIIVLAESFITFVFDVRNAYQAGTLSLPEPQDSVLGWPVVGEKVHAAWLSASTDLENFVEANRERFEGLAGQVVTAAGSTVTGVLGFLGSLIVAGIMMAYGRSGSAAMHRILVRVAGPVGGTEVHTLATRTTRSIAVGVLGVALIQALLLGGGFLFAGIPAAGLLAAIVMFIGIIQLPALIISLPVIAYMWTVGDGSTVHNVVWTVYLIIAGAADGVLKPMLLGRGVDAPMPVILLGALGGMATGGLVGLFLGGVLLAVGYQIFMKWVESGQNVIDFRAMQQDNSAQGDASNIEATHAGTKTQ